jgi:hypothetical protein
MTSYAATHLNSLERANQHDTPFCSWRCLLARHHHHGHCHRPGHGDDGWQQDQPSQQASRVVVALHMALCRVISWYVFRLSARI